MTLGVVEGSEVAREVQVAGEEAQVETAVDTVGVLAVATVDLWPVPVSTVAVQATADEVAEAERVGGRAEVGSVGDPESRPPCSGRLR